MFPKLTVIHVMQNLFLPEHWKVGYVYIFDFPQTLALGQLKSWSDHQEPRQASMKKCVIGADSIEPENFHKISVVCEIHI